jgi:hypothetical protein
MIPAGLNLSVGLYIGDGCFSWPIVDLFKDAVRSVSERSVIFLSSCGKGLSGFVRVETFDRGFSVAIYC